MLFIFPIKIWPTTEQNDIFSAVRHFTSPLDQGGFYVESRLLSLVVATFSAKLGFLLVNMLFPGATAHAGGMIFFIPVLAMAILTAVLFSSVIYRLGRGNPRLRLTLDMLLLGLVLWSWLF